MKPSKPFLPFHREMVFEYGVAQEVAPGVRRLVCRNPSPFTFKGTNTYIVGGGEVAVIDPGPGDQEHVEALLAALTRRGERVSHIFITHIHSDHSGAAHILRDRTGALLCGMPREGRQGEGVTGPSGRQFLSFCDYDLPVAEGDVISGPGWTLRAIHTPGHAPDHLCYAFEQGEALFCGDHVMGWNTTVIAPPEGHMGSYLASLERLLKGGEKLYLPGHGGLIDTPQRLVKALIIHRRWREAEIMDCLRAGLDSIELIVPRIYGQLESALAGAAALAVFAQIELMIEKGLVRCLSSRPTVESRFAPAAT